MENKHTLYCFKNCGLLHLPTQTFPKNIIVNHLINGENRRDYPHKGERISPPSAMTWLDKTSHVHRVQHHLASTTDTFNLENYPLWGYFATNIFQIKELKAEWHFNNLLELHYLASRVYIFAVWAGVRKVLHGSSHSENVASHEPLLAE